MVSGCGGLFGWRQQFVGLQPSRYLTDFGRQIDELLNRSGLRFTGQSRVDDADFARDFWGDLRVSGQAWGASFRFSAYKADRLIKEADDALRGFGMLAL